MLNINSKYTNTNFTGRNKEIKNAEKILHKIKSDFPASSSYIADLYAQKHNIKTKCSNNTVRSIADMIESYYYTDNVGAKLTTNNLASVRKLQEHYFYNDYKYCDSLIWGVKRFRAMNCKENSELAFLIAKINGYKNCHCISLIKEEQNFSIADLGHSVLLINQEVPINVNKLNKFYVQHIDKTFTFIPSRKSIVIDPLFGIVDYWENAIVNYKTIFPQMSDIKGIYAAISEPIIKLSKDLKKLKKSRPELVINSSVQNCKINFFTKVLNSLDYIFFG